jgi:hypothetical protein
MSTIRRSSCMSGFLLLTAAGLSAADVGTVTSPDGTVAVVCALTDGHIGYRVTVDGAAVLKDSPLGLDLASGSLSAGLTLEGVGAATVTSDHYTLNTSKRSDIATTAREQEFRFATTSGGHLTVRFRVAADGVAFRYLVPVQADKATSTTVASEATGFALPDGATGWLHPMHRPGGWAHTQPSYEAEYAMDTPVGTPSPHKAGWCFPALFRTAAQGPWVMLSEAGTDGGYCATRLAHDSTGGVYRIGFPDAGENRGQGSAQPTITLPFASPWRLVMVGKTLAPLIRSTMPTDVVGQARVTPAKPVVPGRAAWSWVVQDDASCTYDNQKRFIDMAASLGWEYTLIDALWDKKIGRTRIAELVAYARQKHVGVILWYNSNGTANDAPQTPKNLMHERDVRRKEMAWLRDIGVSGLKVDFFGGDKQATMQLYEDILTDAAEFGLSMNFHGTTLPRGWQRMYPNLVTDEAVQGMEFVSMDRSIAERQAIHATNLVFTRNVVAPMDYTPCTLQEKLMKSTRRTTRAFELALPILFQSGVTHFGVCPDNLKDVPTGIVDYLRQIPAQWDDVVLVDGMPGAFAALARRSDKRWFIAGINATPGERTLRFTPTFLDHARTGHLISAGPTQASLVVTPIALDPTKPITVTMRQGDGFVITLDP